MARPSKWIIGTWLIGLSLAATPTEATEIVIYGFEGSPEGWVIPDWAKASTDYVAQDFTVSQSQVGEGQHALEVRADFPGGRWTGAYIEREVEVTDWLPFGRLSADVFVPADAPQGLTGKLILTVGDQWTWTEMNRSIPLTPGEWTTISVGLKPGSMDWKFFPDDNFRASVKKIGVRIESNRDPAYQGSVFVDNIRLAE